MSESSEDKPGPSSQIPSTLAGVLTESAPPLPTITIFTLTVSLVALVILPTAGYVLVKSFFSSVWGSPYDGCGRLWLLASFLTTMLITNNVISHIVGSSKFDAVRRDPNFVKCTTFIRYVPLGALIAGVFLTFVVPARFDPILVMKVIALFVAASMFVLDFFILALVRSADKALRKEFSSTVWFVDLPTFLAIWLVIVIIFIYQQVLPPSQAPGLDHSDNEIFLMGLSSGAVAIELYFANLLFFLVFRDDNSDKGGDDV